MEQTISKTISKTKIMQQTTVNKRVHYSYLDEKKGSINDFIDVNMNQEDDHLPDSIMQKLVQKKWDQNNYKTGFIDSVYIESVQP